MLRHVRMQASIPQVSHAHALELAALYTMGVGPLNDSTTRALTAKLNPWLAGLIQQVRTLALDLHSWNSSC